MTYIGIAQNLTPIITVFMSYFMVGEKIKCIDVLMILIGLVGVTLVTYGFTQKQELKEHSPPLLATIGAFSIPFLLSLGNITMSKMKGLDENTVSLYMNPSLMVIMAIYMRYEGHTAEMFFQPTF